MTYKEFVKIMKANKKPFFRVKVFSKFPQEYLIEYWRSDPLAQGYQFAVLADTEDELQSPFYSLSEAYFPPHSTDIEVTEVKPSEIPEIIVGEFIGRGRITDFGKEYLKQ